MATDPIEAAAAASIAVPASNPLPQGVPGQIEEDEDEWEYEYSNTETEVRILPIPETFTELTPCDADILPPRRLFHLPIHAAQPGHIVGSARRAPL